MCSSDLEGTTAIQGMDFFFRKIVKDQGQALTQLKSEIQEFLDSAGGGERLAAERQLLAAALADVESTANTLFGQAAQALEDPRAIHVVAQSTTDFLMTVGDLVIGWLLLRQAAVALTRSANASAKDVQFYTGKVAAASWFARNILPLLAARRTVVEATDNALMDVPEDAF